MQQSIYLRFTALVVTALAVVGTTACAPGLQEPAGTPVPDPRAVAAKLVRASIPESPRQATFAWTLNEAGTRLQGRGVARFEAPERLRLDLFGPRGETYLSAALIGDTLLVPPAVQGRITLPSPSLLWGALGITHPPAGAQLVSATRTEQDLILRYQSPDGQFFQFQADRSSEAPRLREVERLGDSGVLESIELSYNTEGMLERTRYRDWPAYRELVLDIEEITDASPFPTGIWTPADAGH